MTPYRQVNNKVGCTGFHKTIADFCCALIRKRNQSDANIDDSPGPKIIYLGKLSKWEARHRLNNYYITLITALTSAQQIY